MLRRYIDNLAVFHGAAVFIETAPATRYISPWNLSQGERVFMATVITSECINCGACEPECPNTAIYQGGVEWEHNGAMHPAIAQDIFYIVPEKCTECVGFHDHEACAAVCPVDCCVPDPKIPETEEVLIARARTLHPEQEFSADR